MHMQIHGGGGGAADSVLDKPFGKAKSGKSTCCLEENDFIWLSQKVILIIAHQFWLHFPVFQNLMAVLNSSWNVPV